MGNAAMVYLLGILWGMPATAKGCSGPGTNSQAGLSPPPHPYVLWGRRFRLPGPILSCFFARHGHASAGEGAQK